MDHKRPRLRIFSLLLAFVGLVFFSIGVTSTVADAHHKDSHCVDPFEKDADPNDVFPGCSGTKGQGAENRGFDCPPGLAKQVDKERGTDCTPAQVTEDGDADDGDADDGDGDGGVTVDETPDVLTDVEAPEAPESADVLGVTVAPEAAPAPQAAPSQLAFTGASTTSLAMAGLGLMLMGAAALLHRSHLPALRRSDRS